MEWYIRKVRKSVSVGGLGSLLTDHFRGVSYRRIDPSAFLSVRSVHLAPKRSRPGFRYMLTMETRPLYTCQTVSILVGFLLYLGQPANATKDTFKVCTIDVDLSSIPRYLFRRKVNSQGTVFYELDYHIRMTPKSATLLFELVFSGATYGCLEAKY